MEKVRHALAIDISLRQEIANIDLASLVTHGLCHRSIPTLKKTKLSSMRQIHLSTGQFPSITV